MFLYLLDTGARAREACNVKLENVNLNTGEVLIWYGKGGKTRTVFLGRTRRRAVRAYLRGRTDPSPALFVSNRGGHLTYEGLHKLLERKWKKSGIAKRPGLHYFRRAFALQMPRIGVDVFALQKLLGRSDLQIM